MSFFARIRLAGENVQVAGGEIVISWLQTLRVFGRNILEKMKFVFIWCHEAFQGLCNKEDRGESFADN